MDLLKKLALCPAPPGNEQELRRLIIEQIKDYVDEYHTDNLGNLIARRKLGQAKLMLAAHMDEAGIIVTYRDKKGFARFSNIGHISPFDVIHKKVVFTGGAMGVISYEEKLEDMKELKFNKMFIDTGGQRVEVGETAVLESSFSLMGDMLSCGALDDRVGCWVLINAIKQPCAFDAYYVFTVQEELGFRGAKTAAYAIEPDWAVTVDATNAGDTPEARCAMKLGAGAAVKVKDKSVVAHPVMRSALIKCAREQDIPYQLEVLESDGSGGGAIHMSGVGVPTGGISVPTRYKHSNCQMVHRADLDAAARLAAAIQNTELCNF